MAFIQQIKTNYRKEQIQAYLKITGIGFNRLDNTGRIHLTVWESKAAKLENLNPIGTVTLFIGKVEVIKDGSRTKKVLNPETKKIMIEEFTLPDHGVVQSLLFDDFYEKSTADWYKTLKSKKIMINGYKVDLSLSQDDI